MKIALVSGRSLKNEWDESYSGVSNSLEKYLIWCGFTVIFLGHQDSNKVEDVVDLIKPSLLVFSGGDSIGQNITRDSFEKRLLSKAIESQIPSFGICRGMQLMVNYFGQTLEILPGHAGTRHDLMGDVSLNVGSYHHEGFRSIPSDFAIMARAMDESIEMVKHTVLPWVGVMWHPEREATESWINLQEWYL